MATRFIDKEYGTNSSTAIANDATGTAKVKNLQDAAGLAYDSVSNTFKFNGNDAIYSLVDTASAQTITGDKTFSGTCTFTSEITTSELFAAGTAAAPSVAIGFADDGLYSIAENNIGVALNGAIELNLTTSALSPGANAGSALGTTSLGWNGLHLGTATAINWANGNALLTHATGQVSITGNFLASNAAGPAFLDEAATSTNPTLIPDKAETDTGIGWVSDTLHVVLGGANCYAMAAASLSPGVTNAAALGTTALMWADLFLASGGVVNFDNGNLTLTHATGSLTLAGKLLASNAAGPAFIDEAATSTNPTLCPDKAEEDTGIGWVSDTLHIVLGGANAYAAAAASLSPGVTNAAALGTTSLMWSDLFLAEGAVVNFNSGNATITHSAGKLAVAVAAPTTSINAFEVSMTSGSATPGTIRSLVGAATSFTTMTSGNMVGARGQATLGGNISGTAFVYGTQGKVIGGANSINVGSSMVYGVMGQLDLSSTTVTNGYVAGVGSDIFGVGSGTVACDLFYGQHAGGGTINSYFRAYGKSTYAFEFDINSGTAITTVAAGAASNKWVRIRVDGTAYKIALLDNA